MKAKEIRRAFLDFFEGKKHTIVSSAPLVLKDDPTLMFTNAGMNQFKDYFLGNKIPKNQRVADTQKCLRVSGKHNDLEEVGLDTYHHTMFEMLGNWSFGDYFKKEAISWAWELLTGIYKLPEDRLYATIFQGDEQDNLTLDEEAREIWKDFLPDNRILNGSKKDNFWEMGDTGPCGPCSEIHIDLRPEQDLKKIPGHQLVNQDHPQVVEIWNLVFMQFNRLKSGKLIPLPSRHVDTGMGFERLVMAIQGKSSNYDTDIFNPIIEEVEHFSGKKYGQEESIDIAIRVIADHIRAIAFSIADGQLPSNNKAGYVIRRILRRAIRYGFNFLIIKEPFLYKLIPILATQFNDIFPEIELQQDFISKVVREEEISFLNTLENGLKRFNKILENNPDKISGKDAFELYDTFGFPYDLTALLARENKLTVDESSFKKHLEEQKKRSRKDAEKETGDWVVIREGDVQFVGYDDFSAKAKVLKYRTINVKNKDIFQLVLDRTPFYSESGGQVGDTGWIYCGDEKIRVVDTQKENELIIHYVNKIPAELSTVMICEIDGNKRKETACNHSSTHLLHAALREILGEHVQQKGSLVNSELLRFDFSHFSKLSEEEILDVERIVNEKIRKNIVLDEKRNVPIDQAKAMGATALFGEKYGDEVRVITFDQQFSVELCGGTHVNATGAIGFFKIISESSVAAGVRRIEAVTGLKAETLIQENFQLISQLKSLLKAPKNILQSVEKLAEENSNLSKQIQELNQKQSIQVKNELKNKIISSDGIQYIIQEVDVASADNFKNLGFSLKNEIENVIAVLASNINGKPQLLVAIDDQLVKSKGLHAGKLIKIMASAIKGGGGGQPFLAVAGGSDPDGIGKALDIAKKELGL